MRWYRTALAVSVVLAGCREGPPGTLQTTQVGAEAVALEPGESDLLQLEVDLELDEIPTELRAGFELTMRRHVDDVDLAPLWVDVVATTAAGAFIEDSIGLAQDEPVAPASRVELEVVGEPSFDLSCVPGPCSWRAELALTHIEGSSPAAVSAAPFVSLRTRRVVELELDFGR